MTSASATKNSRAIAARILVQVIQQGRSLGVALDEACAQHPQRALIQELCFGTLRHYHRLLAVVEALVDKPLKSRDGDILVLLLLGLYQLTAMRVAPHAAVSETVAATAELNKSWARGLVNGVLRNFQRRSEHYLEQASEQEPGRWMHPGWLIDAIRRAWPEQWQAILEANNQRPPMTLRINQARLSAEAYLARLREADIEGRPAQVAASAIYLDSPRDVRQLPGFEHGLVSVQDEAAQLAAVSLDLNDGQRVLDVCAAPGGKTSHIMELANVEMVAVDIDPARLQRVSQNLSRLGFEAQLIAGDATEPSSWWDGTTFDRILLDAPCSASGVIRRHPDIKVLRRAADIPGLVRDQARILDAVWPLLKPGGILLYATCSVLPEENAQQVEQFLQRQTNANQRELQLGCGHRQSVGYQIFPGESGKNQQGGMDGFYYACLEKQS